MNCLGDGRIVPPRLVNLRPEGGEVSPGGEGASSPGVDRIMAERHVASLDRITNHMTLQLPVCTLVTVSEEDKSDSGFNRSIALQSYGSSDPATLIP